MATYQEIKAEHDLLKSVADGTYKDYDLRPLRYAIAMRYVSVATNHGALTLKLTKTGLLVIASMGKVL